LTKCIWYVLLPSTSHTQEPSPTVHPVLSCGCLSAYWKLQASVAKGHPDDAVSSYKKTLSGATVVEEQLHSSLESPEGAFTLWTVEQLTHPWGNSLTGIRHS
jgi:hypothetical protein